MVSLAGLSNTLLSQSCVLENNSTVGMGRAYILRTGKGVRSLPLGQTHESSGGHVPFVKSSSKVSATVDD